MKKEVELERKLKLLANRRRLSIIALLQKKKGVHVGAIAEKIRLSLTATSRHLSMLERAGFLEKEQKSLNVFYRIASTVPETFKRIFVELL